MDDNLRITSSNCFGLKTSLYQVYELCEISDIVFLQETLLFSHELSMLSTLHPEFEGMGVSAIDSTSGIITSRPFGGVAILIRKKLRQYCNFIFYDDPQITGLEIKCVLDSVHLINVYLPYQCHDNYDDYVEYLGKISAIIEGCATSKLAVIGDFNAAVETNFERELLTFCTDRGLIISDYHFFGRVSDQFTYVSDAHGTTSWLDHFICSHNLHCNIVDMKILDKSPCSDHLPIYAKLKLDIGLSVLASSSVPASDVTFPTINYQWAKATDVDVENYRHGTQSKLSHITIPEVVYCTDVRCNDEQHRHHIDMYYDSICKVLTSVGKLTIPTNKFKCSQDYIVPGLNEHLKELHCDARAQYLIWRNDGKPRNGESHGNMRNSRLRFKYAFRQCRANEEMMRADALAHALYSRDSTSFWKDVRKMASAKIPLATKVGDAVGNADITAMWQAHFSELLNSVHDISSKSFVCEHVDAVLSDSRILVTSCDVSDSLKKVKLGKSAGIDGLAAEHFVYSHERISVHLAMLFTSMLTHGYLPDAFMTTSIIPILKNKNGDTSAKNNYRPIAIVTAMSKIFELCLDTIMDAHLVTSDNQFGFKQKHSTDLCIYTVKSIIQYYNYYNSPVYTCFLDASKAFDRVNHWTMFKKLILRGVPIIIVRMLCFWYRSQQLCIQWGKTRSSFFTISNGVRQGGILSSKLFSVYMDDLSNLLISSGIGCFLDKVCFNHVFYADDLCLMAPCAIALQELLNICHSYSITVDVNFNALKSFCVAFTPKLFKLRFPELNINAALIPYTDSIKYLGFTSVAYLGFHFGGGFKIFLEKWGYLHGAKPRV